MTAENNARLHAVVHGRVQGVSFRYYTVEQATALDLTGWVRNVSDGTVEVTAEGSRDDLESLLAFLQRGPSAAHVTKVEVTWGAFSGKFVGFQVRYGFG